MNLAGFLIPTSLDAKQALRLRHFGLAGLCYTLGVVLLAVGWALDNVPASTVLENVAAYLAINLGLYAVFRSGFNLRFRDPSLTRIQILVAITVLMQFIYHLDNGRNVALLACFIIFVFGVFQLQGPRLHCGHTLALSQRNNWLAAIMFIDLDRFKAVNDRLGHGIGDQLLVQATQWLRECVRSADIVARLGGDEFAIVLSNLAKADAAGLVPPLEFISILEDTGFIVPVGEWVVRTVCEQLGRWRAEGVALLPVAVNLSARQFHQKDLDAVIGGILQATGIDPRLLEFELTESMLMSDPEAAVITLKNLKAYRIRLSVDDFGTGYSSLSHLKRFPLDALKIDRDFVRDVTTDADDATIAVAIISLAHNLKLTVVAEGVETAAQLNFLRAHGCDEMQGYYFARPLTIADCTRALNENRRLPSRDLVDRADAPAVLLVARTGS